MKRLICIGGPMGVGKSSVCRHLCALLPQNVFLDGDWCWQMRPFSVNPETKAMVLENIRFLLGQFLKCSAYQNVLFCWVMHEQAIIDALLSGLELAQTEVFVFTLLADPASLAQRVQADVANGLRDADALPRSLQRLESCRKLNTIRLDTSARSPQATAQCILEHILSGEGRAGVPPESGMGPAW